MDKIKGNYRRHRFIALSSLHARDSGEPDPFQQGYDDGFVQGQEKGLHQGLEDGRRQGQQQGFENGFREGKGQGETAGRADFEQALAPLVSVQHALEQARQQQLADNTDSLCALVEQVARRVIHAELSLNPSQILTLVQEAVGRLDSTKGPIKIFLSSDDHQRLGKVGINQCGDYPLLADGELGTGDCRLESDQQQLLIRSEERLQNCMAQVRDELENEQ
ncbi:FliH/SctL family protein [Gallaecimonas xiamenensis]|uniref:Flagellar assembly protein FliH n=1 Tax=Gallaecimonas xiamenensis 3-C-1 TaxID=745411 RepID=K2JHB4_9GAMM|nr:FliH/SctL family protein [Gallaecimonas xiamenensis]EKE73967.1 lateral flagellar assembly protein FliH [Gallaecimonas xiamenensis 3-C-1]